MLSPSLEDYLEELYRFSLSQQVVRVTDISQKLGVSLPSVSKALYKLKMQNYITYLPYGLINLTDQGREHGGFLVARNGLLQEFLTLLHVGCDIVAEVEGMEHYFSQETVRGIQSFVEFMKKNPKCYKKFLSYLEKNKLIE